MIAAAGAAVAPALPQVRTVDYPITDFGAKADGAEADLIPFAMLPAIKY